MKILLYQIYGSDRRYHLELTYSVLSAAQFLRDSPSDIRIVLLSDEKNKRADLPLENIVLPSATLQEWQMEGSYKHAMQAYCLHHALETFAAPTVLIDSDTRFRRHPSVLFNTIGPGRTLMHVREGKLSNTPEWPEWEHLISSSGGYIEGLTLSRDTEMFNAGVLGAHPSDTDLLNQIKAVMFRTRELSRVFTAVQLAASLVFHEKSELSTCEDAIDHYWSGPREYFHYQMQRIFPDVAAGSNVAAPDAPLPPLCDMPRGNPFFRFAARARRLQRRAPASYGHAYTAYLSALALRRRDPELANVWAGVAVNALVWGMSRRMRATEKDFRRFGPSGLKANTWLLPNVQRRWEQYWNWEIGPDPDQPPPRREH